MSLNIESRLEAIDRKYADLTDFYSERIHHVVRMKQFDRLAQEILGSSVDQALCADPMLLRGQWLVDRWMLEELKVVCGCWPGDQGDLVGQPHELVREMSACVRNLLTVGSQVYFCRLTDAERLDAVMCTDRVVQIIDRLGRDSMRKMGIVAREMKEKLVVREEEDKKTREKNRERNKAELERTLRKTKALLKIQEGVVEKEAEKIEGTLSEGEKIVKDLEEEMHRVNGEIGGLHGQINERNRVAAAQLAAAERMRLEAEDRKVRAENAQYYGGGPRCLRR